MDLQLAHQVVAKIDLPQHTSVGWEVRSLVAKFPKGIRLNSLVWCVSDMFSITDFQARQVIVVCLEAKLITQVGWYIYNL